MKKFLLLLFLLSTINSANATVIYWPDVITPDDLTKEWINGFKNTVVDTLNSFPGDNIAAGTIPHTALDDNSDPVTRWKETFNNYVYTGLLPVTTVGTLISTTTAGTAYIEGERVVKDATNHTYTATKYTFIDLSSNGTYTYSEITIGAAEPAVTANSIRLCRVTTDATKISAVRDDRVLGVQLSTNEDFYLKGMKLYFASTTEISVDDGVAYSGSTRISKVATTVLNISTAADYITGVSERAVSTWLYVYTDSSGNIKLDDNAPDYHDTSGTAVGELYYYKNGTTYWRKIGQAYLNSTGSGNVAEGNLIYGDIDKYWTQSAWVVYTGSTGAVLNSYPAGVTITNTGVGDETVNWPVTFANANYVAAAIPSGALSLFSTIRASTVTTTQVATADHAGAATDGTTIMVFVFGN